MIPQAVAAILGISIADLIESAPIAADLRAALDIASKVGNPKGTFFRFVNQYVKSVAGSTRQQAALAYRQAQAWTNQGAAISKYPPQMTIDPSLARDIILTDTQQQIPGSFRVWVEASVQDEATGKTRAYSFYIDSPNAPNLATMYDYARFRLEDVIAKSPPVSGVTDLDEYYVTFKLLDFGRYTN